MQIHDKTNQTTRRGKSATICNQKYCFFLFLIRARQLLTRKVPNTTIDDFANTVDSDETALSSGFKVFCPPSLCFYNI